MAASKGVWFDTKSGKVVESQPEEGVQLVAPGTEFTPDAERLVEVYRSGGKPEPKTVTTTTASKSK